MNAVGLHGYFVMELGKWIRNYDLEEIITVDPFKINKFEELVLRIFNQQNDKERKFLHKFLKDRFLFKSEILDNKEPDISINEIDIIEYGLKIYYLINIKKGTILSKYIHKNNYEVYYECINDEDIINIINEYFILYEIIHLLKKSYTKEQAIALIKKYPDVVLLTNPALMELNLTSTIEYNKDINVFLDDNDKVIDIDKFSKGNWKNGWLLLEKNWV